MRLMAVKAADIIFMSRLLADNDLDLFNMTLEAVLIGQGQSLNLGQGNASKAAEYDTQQTRNNFLFHPLSSLSVY